MTNREKYADILNAIQAKYPAVCLETLFGLARDTHQPVSCDDLYCRECMWQEEACTACAKKWLATIVEDDKREEEKQMKKKCAVQFEGRTGYYLLSDDQIKVFQLLEDNGWNITIEVLDDSIFEEL